MQSLPPAIAAINSYLALVEGGPPPTVRQLACAIDTLVAAVHAAPPGEPADSNASPPMRDYPGDRDRLARRFEGLGYYGIADPLVIKPTLSTVGDAIDDLADIGSDLREVLWRYEANGADDALWQFHFLFLIHWGQHARELSLYLHARIRAEDEG